MKAGTILLLIIAILLSSAAIFMWESKRDGTLGVENPIGVNSSFDQTISDGTLTFAYSTTTFGLATNQTQLLVNSYIPPCDAGFTYCFYYIGNDYEATNFESAGIRVQKRPDITSERICLDTPPLGFNASMKPTELRDTDTYSSSVFSNIGDAGAGHYASGSEYRLFVKNNSTCYEVETRVGQTQFQNYPTSTIEEFTVADEADMRSLLEDFVDSITLHEKEKKLF